MGYTEDGSLQPYVAASIGPLSEEPLFSESSNHESHVLHTDKGIVPSDPLPPPPLSFSPINQLPPDVLLLVFTELLWINLALAAPNDEAAKYALNSCPSSPIPPILLSMKHSPLLFCSVCTHWRSICLSSATLWSNLYLLVHHLDLNLPDSEDGTSRAAASRTRPANGFEVGKARAYLTRLFLQRSGSAPLTLFLNGTADDRLSADLRGMPTARIFHECAAHKHRWRSVDVTGVNDRGLLEPFLNGNPALALESLTIHIKQVAEDEIGVEGGYDWRLWYLESGMYTVRRGMARELVAGLGVNYPRLRYFELGISEVNVLVLYDILNDLGASFADPSGSSCDSFRVENEQTVAKGSIGHQEFRAWQGTQTRALDALVRELPAGKGRLKAIWVKCIKAEGRVGVEQLDVDVQDARGFGPARSDCRF